MSKTNTSSETASLGDRKKFHKYTRYGAYHWRWYGRRLSYTRHVDFVRRWIKEKNTIDIGAGDGLITSLAGIRGIDNDPKGVEVAAARGVTIDHGSAYDLPYKDEEFDSALMSDTIEHFSDVGKALNEVRRVIKKYFYVNIPARERFTEPDHYHSWTAQDFVEEVEGYGFKLLGQPKVKYARNRIYFKFEKV